MNSYVRAENEVISVDLTPDEALALTGVKYHGNSEIEASARRKIRNAFEKTFDFLPKNHVD
ncbi:hypothetical protein PASE110613_11015 [Paenibacillus sediminis]|uniref:Uncharacterized protein n=1 Tax=Paenibacillus sediminis TaxID=664909 RepID=A0ABS4H4P6_9BACL|nr:hypothetical protein [Paenibacillus sediminis]MBP1937486.1 hypothetical protein [Paenibacillus sediminis]